MKTGENKLAPVTQRIVVDDGTPLIVQGRGLFSIKLGQRDFSYQAVVANINAYGILGLDLLQTNQCIFDVCKTRMYVYGLKNELVLQENSGCFRVSRFETICIPPRSKIIYPVQMLDIPESSPIQMLFEPFAKFQDSEKALLARLLLINSSERESDSDTDEYI